MHHSGLPRGLTMCHRDLMQAVNWAEEDVLGGPTEVFAVGDHGTLLRHSRPPVASKKTTWGHIKKTFE